MVVSLAGINKTLDQFTYEDGYINDLIVESFYEIEFIGLKGLITFDKHEDLSGLVGFSQQLGECQSSEKF